MSSSAFRDTFFPFFYRDGKGWWCTVTIEDGEIIWNNHSFWFGPLDP